MTAGSAPRRKGDRIERELVHLHKALGVDAQRVPLSGAAGGRFSGDVDIYPFGQDEGALVSEVKARSNGAGFATIERWLGDNDLLFLRRDRADPMVVLPWKTYVRLLKAAARL